VILFELLQEYEARFHVGLLVEVPEVLPTSMFATDLKGNYMITERMYWDVVGLLITKASAYFHDQTNVINNSLIR